MSIPIFAAVAALLIGAFASSVQAETLVGLCLADEKVFLACKTTNERWLSLCGSGATGVQYRFGRQGKVELQYPEEASDGPQQLRFAHYARYQRDRVEIRFDRQDVSYAVFDDVEGSVHSTGVEVTGSDGRDHALLCRGSSANHLSQLQPLLRCDPDSALNGGKCP